MGCGSSLGKGKQDSGVKEPTPAHLQQPFDKENRNLHDYYDVKETIGQGSVAKCKLATDKKTGQTVAVKILERKHSEFDYDGLILEIEVMRRVDHPGCIKLYDVYEDTKSVFLIQELAQGGELFDRVIENGAYCEQDAARLFKQMMEAVAHLHSMGIAHRDLKPENVLMKAADRKSPEYNLVKLADFGLSTIKADDYNDTMMTACGTPEYIAPEIIVTLKEGGATSRQYSAKVDIWAAGVILYVMLCGFQPFQLENQNAMYQAIRYGRYSFPSPEWDEVSQGAKDFIAFMLQVKPQKRPTAAECLEHEWIQKHGFGRTQSLNKAQSKLVEYNASMHRKTFKKAVTVVQAVKRMQSMTRATQLTSGSGASPLAGSKEGSRQSSAEGVAPESGGFAPAHSAP
mmetsp:Transcript_23864/g.56795  ORF Transcript_23864/g.56795 Transcript_23864/m.56795 type:complete len:400 (+) Transcript_23864:360-1559(+)